MGHLKMPISRTSMEDWLLAFVDV